MKDVLMIWDLDGTLVDAKGCGRGAMDKAFYSLFGIENAFQGIRMAGRLDGIIVRDALAKHHIESENIDLFYDTYCSFLEEEVKREDRIELLPGIREILEMKKEYYNFFHVLGTGNIEKGARLKLKPHDLNKYFPTGGFGDQGLERWEIIDLAIELAEQQHKVKFKKEDIFVIGDTPLDIECGKILGIKSVAVATGPHSLEELTKHQPDYVFSDFKEPQSFFKALL